MIPIILDMDPGIDDAVALSIALSNPSIDIKLGLLEMLVLTKQPIIY